MTEPAPESARRFLGASLQGGRYVVSGVLGAGAQGHTLEAIDKRDGTLVAIKRFQVRGARSWKDVELAEREAVVLARLSHDLLPTAIAHFEEGGALYLVMQRIEGKTLAEERGLSRGDVIRFLRDADRVLAYLHGQAPPVIHRDIKPSNVIRRPSHGGPASHVLVDFGSVRASLKPSGGSTVVGTFGYMAPEQFQGRALPQSDVYSVGATALALLTGQQPEDLPHKGLAIDVRAALPGDEALARVLEQMVEPNPDIRPARIGPLLEHLRAEQPPAPRESVRPRRERKQKRRETRRSKSKEARRRPRESSRGPFSPLVLPLVVTALIVARIAVMLTLRALVPTLLTLMSLVFGEALKRAARAVDRAGVLADSEMRRATLRMKTGRGAEEKDASPPKVRIDVDDRARITGDEGHLDVDDAMKQAQDEVSAALEEVAQEVDAIRGKPKRKKHYPGEKP